MQARDLRKRGPLPRLIRLRRTQRAEQPRRPLIMRLWHRVKGRRNLCIRARDRQKRGLLPRLTRLPPRTRRAGQPRRPLIMRRPYRVKGRRNLRIRARLMPRTNRRLRLEKKRSLRARLPVERVSVQKNVSGHSGSQWMGSQKHYMSTDGRSRAPWRIRMIWSGFFSGS